MSYGFWIGPASLVAIFLFALAWWLWSGEKVRAERVEPEDSHIEVWKSWYAEGKVSLEQFEVAVEEQLRHPSWSPNEIAMSSGAGTTVEPDLRPADWKVQQLPRIYPNGHGGYSNVPPPNPTRYIDTTHLNREAQRKLYLSLRSRGMVE